MTVNMNIRTKDGEEITPPLDSTAARDAHGSSSAFLVKDGNRVLGYITSKRLEEDLKEVGLELR
jgi:hypothetical protein